MRYNQLELLYQDEVLVSGVTQLEVITNPFCYRNIWDLRCLAATLIWTVASTAMSTLVNWSQIVTTHKCDEVELV